MEEQFYEKAKVKNGVLLKYELEDAVQVTIPEGITELAEDAFEDGYCLESVQLPDSLAVLDSSAFNNCCNLSAFILSETNPHFTFDGTALFNKDKTVLIKVVPTYKGHYDIPDTVVTVGKMAFDNCDVASVTFPGSVKSIGNEAFSCCDKLTDVNLSVGLKEIGGEAFNCCNKLTSVAIPEGVTAIGWAAFSMCDNLASVTIPSSVTTIRGYAFSHCKALTAVTIPKGITTIETGAFRGCKNLTSLFFPEGVTTIGEGAFALCEKLTAVTIPKSVTTIEEWKFEDWKAFPHRKPTVYALPGSVSWKWAEEKGFPVEKMKSGVCPYCGGKLKGLIFKKCTACGNHK